MNIDFNDYRQVKMIYLGLVQRYSIIMNNAELLGDEYIVHMQDDIDLIIGMILELEKRYGFYERTALT